jgi:hypothetical protein
MPETSFLWKGTVGPKWEDPANWEIEGQGKAPARYPGQLPLPAGQQDSVKIIRDPAKVLPNPIISTDIKIYGLEVNTGPFLTINGSLEVTGPFVLQRGLNVEGKGGAIGGPGNLIRNRPAFLGWRGSGPEPVLLN